MFFIFNTNWPPDYCISPGNSDSIRFETLAVGCVWLPVATWHINIKLNWCGVNCSQNWLFARALNKIHPITLNSHHCPFYSSKGVSLPYSFPIFENPYPMDVHESPVTCTAYFADCPPDIIPVLYSIGAKHKKTGYSHKVSQNSKLIYTYTFSY